MVTTLHLGVSSAGQLKDTHQIIISLEKEQRRCSIVELFFKLSCFSFLKNCICLMAVLSLCCYAWAFSSCGELASHGRAEALGPKGFSSYGTWA